MTSTAELRQLEESLLHSSVREQPERVAALLAEEFREFGSSGRTFTRAQVIRMLAEEEPADLSLLDFEVTLVSSGTALVTYRSFKASEAEVSQAWRSSLWVVRDGRWQMLFHQGTKVAQV